jgi:tetratricopeptide (TPR) repeat protein
MNAFIVRPFGQRNGIDFDHVEAELIRPAFEALGLVGGTTELLVYAGNIRTDMFEQLLLADIVVADISIHNANVFYELGVRHGLRDKRTVLIRARADEVPFDLRTDRYLEYNKDNPAANRDQLIKVLRATLDSERRDSPVFLLLPELTPPKREAFLIVPEDFGKEVDLARTQGRPGDLALLAAEAHGFSWEVAALRTVGRAQFNLGALTGARSTWERVLNFSEADVEANLVLGTIYQRLGDLTASDRALQKALDSGELTQSQRAEAFALQGSNAKTRWREQWSREGVDAPQEALQSVFLLESQERYAAGYREDLNHYYSGLNALAMLTVRLELARALPEVWAQLSEFEDEGQAKKALGDLETEHGKLAIIVERSLAVAKKRSTEQARGASNPEIWIDISIADHRCLTSKQPRRVADAYRRALARATPFDKDAVRRQLRSYEAVGVMRENVKAALAIPELAREETKPRKAMHVFLFTGHQLDSPGRRPPRFPPDKENMARERIKVALETAIRELGDAPRLGLAGAASGGDILFHEVCAELGIPTNIYLALPENKFINESVAPAQGNWVERFNALLRTKKESEVRQLAETDEMPKWLRARQSDYGIWQRNNLWMLYNAVTLGGKHTTLIALWDGESGDGPGGTKDMVNQARTQGARTIIINTKREFGL